MKPAPMPAPMNTPAFPAAATSLPRAVVIGEARSNVSAALPSPIAPAAHAPTNSAAPVDTQTTPAPAALPAAFVFLLTVMTFSIPTVTYTTLTDQHRSSLRQSAGLRSPPTG